MMSQSMLVTIPIVAQYFYNKIQMQPQHNNNTAKFTLPLAISACLNIMGIVLSQLTLLDDHVRRCPKDNTNTYIK